MGSEKTIFQNDELEMKKEAINVIVNDIVPKLKEIIKICGIGIINDSICRITIIGPSSSSNINAVTLEGFNITWENIIDNIANMAPKYQLNLIGQILLDFENQLMSRYDNVYIFYNDLSNPGIVLSGIAEKKLPVIRNNIVKKNSEIFERLMSTYDDIHHEPVFEHITEHIEANDSIYTSYYISNNDKIILRTVRGSMSPHSNLYLEIFILKKNICFKKFRDDILDIIYGGKINDRDSSIYIEPIGVVDFTAKQFQIFLTETLFKARRITENYIESEKDNNQTT